jgi:hypothetical protein
LKRQYVVLFFLLAASLTRAEISRAIAGLGPSARADVASLTVSFMTNSSDLKPEAKRILDTLGSVLRSPSLENSCFEIRGYADETGSAQYNKQLSEERVQSVIRYLTDHAGIEKDRMISRGFGKSHPIASDATQEGREKNRRVEIENLGYGDAIKDRPLETRANGLIRKGQRLARSGLKPTECGYYLQLILRDIQP